ncbi:MAG: hypothetical protein V1929_12245 [bacterium]
MDKQPTGSTIRMPRLGLILFSITLLYTVGYFTWYGGTALGLRAVLDGKEILYLAQSMARGDISGEPFFRAPLYPATLAILLKAGLPASSLLMAARCFNGCCHLLSTMLIFWMARRVWRKPSAALLSGLVFGLNPVVVYFAADPFDISMGITWLLSGLYFAVAHLQSVPGEPRRRRDIFLAGLFWSLGALTRPQLTLVAEAWPLIVFVHAGRDRWRPTMAALAAFGIVFGAFGVVNWKVSGTLAFMPTCAAYTLYIGNEERANGRYYTQVMDFPNAPPYANTVMLESEARYAQETGQALPVDRDAMNRHWRAKFFQHVFDQPVAWIRLMAWKTYYALNGYEQYNNKTYSLQRGFSPWLRLNPINWSVVLLLGAGGVIIGFRQAAVRWMAFLVMLYAAGLILFSVSDRYRLPLVPLLAVLAGGWLSGDRKPWPALAAVLIPVGFLSLTSFGNVNDRSTFVEDYILMGHAALEAGRDHQAVAFAEQAVGIAPRRSAPRELLEVARYNLLLAGLPALPDRVDLERRHDQCVALQTYTDKMPYLAGLYAWLLGNGGEAVATWQRLVDENSKEEIQALAALLMADRLRPGDRDRIAYWEPEPAGLILVLAKAAAGDETAKEVLLRHMTREERDAQVRALQQLFFQGRQTIPSAGGALL